MSEDKFMMTGCEYLVNGYPADIEVPWDCVSPTVAINASLSDTVNDPARIIVRDPSIHHSRVDEYYGFDDTYGSFAVIRPEDVSIINEIINMRSAIIRGYAGTSINDGAAITSFDAIWKKLRKNGNYINMGWFGDLFTKTIVVQVFDWESLEKTDALDNMMLRVEREGQSTGVILSLNDVSTVDIDGHIVANDVSSRTRSQSVIKQKYDREYEKDWWNSMV